MFILYVNNEGQKVLFTFFSDTCQPKEKQKSTFEEMWEAHNPKNRSKIRNCLSPFFCYPFLDKSQKRLFLGGGPRNNIV
jgi:hypothetical protein